MRGSFTPTINNQKPHKQSPRAGYHPHPMLTASFKSSENQLSSVASINSHAEVVDKILAAAPASLCRSAKDLVYFQANTPNSTILHELNKHGITGAPVLRVPRRTNEDVDSGRLGAGYEGFIDVSDICMEMLTVSAEPKTRLAKLAKWLLPKNRSVAGHAVNGSGLDPFAFVQSTDSLKEATRYIVEDGVQRVAVFEASGVGAGSITGIVTPCAILREVRNHLGTLGPLENIPVGALFPCSGPKAVVTTHMSSPAYRALHLMLRSGYSGVPIVDDDGAMVSSITFKDMRNVAGLQPDAAKAALKAWTTLELASARPSGGYPRSEPRDSAVLLRDRMTAVPSDTLASVITALAASRAHRMYIVDEENRPIGIITTRALLNLLMSPSVSVSDGWRTTLTTTITTMRKSSWFLRRPPTEDIWRVLRATPVNSALTVRRKAMCAANHCTVAECEEKMKDGYIAITSGEEMSKAQRHRVPSVLPMPLGSGFIGWLDTQSLIAARLEAESSWAPERTLVGDVLQFNYVDDPTAEHGRVKRYSLGGRFCRSPFWSVSKDLSLEDTIRILHEKKLQRVAVVDVDDSNTPVLGVLTCSDAIRRLSSHRHNIGKLAITTLQSMSSGQLPVPTGRLDQSLESALLAIITQGLQALPITDGTGALVWSLTLNDVQSLAFNTSTAVAACLRMTVCEYLKWHNMFGRCPLSLRMDDSVGIALELMAAMDVLAITIVDAQLTPIGQVTAQHIFEQIVKKK